MAAFLGGGVTLIAVFVLAQTNRTMSPLRLVLVGVALSYGFSAITDYVIFASHNTNLQSEILFWLLGSLGGATWVQLLLPVIALLTIALAALLEAGRLKRVGWGADRQGTRDQPRRVPHPHDDRGRPVRGDFGRGCGRD